MKTLSLLLISVLLVLLYACESQENFEFRNQSALKDSTSQQRFIVRKDFNRSSIQMPDTNFTESDLWGDWKDSILLYHEKQKWNGFDPLDKSINLSLHESSKYDWLETYTKTDLDSQGTGQFWTWKNGDSTFLMLASNPVGDTLFEHGDTVFTRQFLINFLEKDTLILSDYDRYAGVSLKNEAILLIRKN